MRSHHGPWLKLQNPCCVKQMVPKLSMQHMSFELNIVQVVCSGLEVLIGKNKNGSASKETLETHRKKQRLAPKQQNCKHIFKGLGTCG